MNMFILKFILVLGSTLSGIGAMRSSAHDWSEIQSVSFVFGAVTVLDPSITTAFIQPPPK